MLIVCRKLTWPSINALNLQRQPVHLVFQHLQPSGFPGHQRKSTGVDLLAAFTNGLIKQWTREKEKTSKQQSTTSIEEKEVDKLLENINILYDDIDVRRLDAKQLDDHILQALENKEYEIFQHTIDQCSKYKKLPSTEVLKRIFPLLCISEYNNALSTTAKLIYTCEQQRVNLFDEQPMLKPFHAQRLWYNGQLVEALEHLKGLLKHSDSNVKKNILQNYRRIVQDTLANHSEAIIINLVDHAASILDEYNDLTVVELIWMNCFSSDWFSDQQMANDIFKKHELLRQTVGARCSLITSSLLYQHNISAIYRLIEQVEPDYLH